MSVPDFLYFVALLPDIAIRQEITTFKHLAAERFGSSHALKSPPHITLVPPFRCHADAETGLKAALAESASRLNSFSVQLRNFNHFGQRVIYVDVVANEGLRYCQQMTAEVFLEKTGIQPQSRSFHPHMTVAFRDLGTVVFSEAWAYFSQQKYEQQFTAESLTLLRHNGQRWEVIANSFLTSS